jgi:hypothetical protein
MSNHAENLHVGLGILGAGLAGAIVANDLVRRQARIEAEAEANSVRSVRALGRELTASRSREAALQEQLNAANFRALRAEAALRRVRGH